LNILRWDLEVPANSVDDKAYTLEYQFTLAYDKNLVIATPAPQRIVAATMPATIAPGTILENQGGFGSGNTGAGRGGRGGGGGIGR